VGRLLPPTPVIVPSRAGTLSDRTDCIADRIADAFDHIDRACPTPMTSFGLPVPR